MKFGRYFLVFGIIMHFLFSMSVFAENNGESSIIAFEENWALNFLVNFDMGVFNGLNHAQYETDRPWSIGIGLRYKMFSAQVLMPLSIDEIFNITSFSFETESYFDYVYFEVYFKGYPNLIIPDIGTPHEIDIYSTGIMATFLQNDENHNLRSVNKLDSRQNKSSGSLLYGFGVFYSSLFSPTATIARYNERQHLIYFGPGIGYSYTWIFPKNFFLNALLVTYLTPAVNLNNGNWVFIPQLQPKIVVGHHNKKWSANIKMANDASFIFWNKNDIDILTLISITVMFSKRF